MNLILVSREELKEHNRAILTGRRFNHIVKVLGGGAGRTLEAGVIDGGWGAAEILRLTDTEVEIQLVADQNAPKPLDLTLICALPRPKEFRRLLREIVTLGVKRVFFINAQKVEKSYWNSHFLGEEFLREEICRGLEQAKDTIWPEVQFRRQFRPFVEDELSLMVKGNNIEAVFGRHGASDLCPISPSSSSKILIVGPEGGFNSFEEELIYLMGARPVGLGARVLTVKCAVQVAIGRWAL